MAAENDLRIAVVGAGSVSFGMSILGDLMTKGYEPLQGSTIVLHDINEKAVQRTSGVFKNALEEARENGEPLAFKIETSTDPKQALSEANYVIMSIEHGNRMETWAQDYYIPRKYGSRQIYGENGGPGGAFHTWRQIPPMLNIVHTMEDVCKDAWLMNFSNPLPRIQRVLTKASEIKTVGLCHGVMSGMWGLSSVLNTSIENLNFTSAGLNHFFWMVKVNAKKDCELKELGPFPSQKIQKGQDLLPLIRERGLYWAKERELPLIEQFLELYGYLSYPEQSHPGEYVPWADAYCPYVKYDFKEFQKGGADMKRKLDLTLEGKESNYWWVHESGEREIDIIVGMEQNTGHLERAVNMPNHGAISNLPNECIVECPAIIDKNGIHLEPVGSMPKGVAQLLLHESIVQELVAEAAITGDHNTAIQALIADSTLPSPDAARAVFEEMLKVQGKYLPQFKKK